jgi:hypothetical protein
MELKAELQFSAAPLGRFGGPSVLAGGASGAFWVRLDLRIVLLRTFGKRNELFIIVDAQPYTSNNDIGHSNHRNRTTTRRHIHLPFTQGGLRVRTRFGSGGSQGPMGVRGNITAINASQIWGVRALWGVEDNCFGVRLGEEKWVPRPTHTTAYHNTYTILLI